MQTIDNMIIETLKRLIRENRKIQAIKLYKDLYGVSLSEAKSSIDTLDFKGNIILHSLNQEAIDFINSKENPSQSLEDFNTNKPKKKSLLPALLVLLIILIILLIKFS